jgi:hypothetical protein
MRQGKASDGLHDTLGFYQNGIPAIFLAADIALGAQPALRNYRSFLAAGPQQFPAGEAGRQLLDGFESSATFIHELRHFHDALLSRSLFLLFVLRTTMNWTVLQVLSRWRHEMPDRLPLELRVAAKRATGELAGLFRSLQRQAAAYKTIEQRFYPAGGLRVGKRVMTTRELLETNAILAELFNIQVAHGERVAERYYHEVARRLGSEYWTLVEEAIVRCGGLQRAMSALHYVVSCSLWMGGNPMETFCELFDALSPAAAKAMARNEGSPLRSIFEDEHVLRRHVADGSIVDLTGHHFDVDQVPEEVREVLELPKVIYDARATLVREFVERAGANPLKYAEGIPGLPVPAVFFYPSAVSKKQGYVNGVAHSSSSRASWIS